MTTKNINAAPNPQIFKFEERNLGNESDSDSDWESVASGATSSEEGGATSSEEDGEPMTGQQINQMIDQVLEAQRFINATRPKTVPSKPLAIPARKSNDRDFDQFE